MSLTAAKILEATKTENLPREKVMTPGWATNGQPPGEACVYVRALAGTEVDDAQKLFDTEGENESDKAPKIRTMAAFCVLCVCDEHGKRLFKPEHVPALLTGRMPPVLDCFNVGMRLSGLTDDDQKEMAKNSAAGQSDGSPST